MQSGMFHDSGFRYKISGLPGLYCKAPVAVRRKARECSIDALKKLRPEDPARIYCLMTGLGTGSSPPVPERACVALKVP
jgi:hypothetical protein